MSDLSEKDCSKTLITPLKESVAITLNRRHSFPVANSSSRLRWVEILPVYPAFISCLLYLFKLKISPLCMSILFRMCAKLFALLFSIKESSILIFIAARLEEQFIILKS